MGGDGGSAGTGGTAGDGGSGGMSECPMGCDDMNECTEDVCTDGMCSNTAVTDNTQCDLGGLPGRCMSGRCEGLCSRVDCDDGNLCTEDTCDPADGICDYVPVDCDDGNQCTDDACDAAGGLCSHTAVQDDTSCGDSAGTCQGGSCVGRFACTEAGIREAIAVGGGPHTFDCGGPMTVVTVAEIRIDNDVILDGEGNLTVDGNESHGVLFVAQSVTAELRGFTVTRGAATTEGGGICNFGGRLTLTNSTVSGNTANSGGGIWNIFGGQLTLTNSTVSGNTANRGGGIANVGGLFTGGATLALTNSTVSGNTGVGISNSGLMTLTNSTVSGNDGFGITGIGVSTLTNSTISGNSRGSLEVFCSEFGVVFCGRFDVINSTVSGDTACSDIYGGFGDEGPLCFSPSVDSSTLTNTVIDGVCSETWVAASTSNGHNIESPGNTCGFDQLTDQTSVTEMQLNLGPLADNGGPTQTHALGPGSFAIDQIPVTECVDVDSMLLTEDQRGVTRPQGAMCDVGAFELEVGP